MNARAVIIATGPSLTQADVDLVCRLGRRVYAVNDAYRLCRPDVLYACDEEWWAMHHADTNGVEAWTTSDEAAHKYGLNHIPGRHADNARKYFDASGHGIIYGGNSGFQALNLSYVHGCRDAVLLGFDMGHDNGKKHFFGDHPAAIEKPSPYPSWIKHFNMAAPEIAAAGMVVVNATRRTRLECFKRVALEDVN